LIVLLLSGCSAAAAPREKARGRGEEERKAEGWSWRVNSDSDLRLVALLNGKRVYSFRIGAGGAIGAMDEETGQTPRPLLSPSAHGEHTDRIIQWTVWCQDIVSDVADLSETGRRFNMTQGGDQDGAFSAIRDVEVADGGGRIDVYAVAQDQWKPQQRKVIHCKLSALSRSPTAC
jgi:hypothetical protein